MSEPSAQTGPDPASDASSQDDGSGTTETPEQGLVPDEALPDELQPTEENPLAQDPGDSQDEDEDAEETKAEGMPDMGNPG